MKIERVPYTTETHVIRRGATYFQCFDGDDGVLWISTPHLARWFDGKEDAEKARLEIRDRTALRARRRRKAKQSA